MSRPADWWVLDLPGDPTPGDPVRVRALSRSADRMADDAGDAHRAVLGLAGDGAVLSWLGAAGEVFRGALGDFPQMLSKLQDSYDQAAQALGWWAGRLDDLQATADRALAQGRQARAEVEALQASLASARAAASSASAASARLAQVPAGGPPPDPAQLRAAVSSASAASSRVSALSGQLSSAQARLQAARSMAEQARELRSADARTTAHRLREASDAGIAPKSRWERFKDAAAAAWKVTVKVATVVAIVVAVVALFVGGPIVWGILLAASAVLLADSLHRYGRGEASAWEVGLNLLGVVPGGRLLTAVGKATGLAGAGARVAGAVSRPLAAAGTRLRTAATAVRSGADDVLTRVRGLVPDAGHLRLGRRVADDLPPLPPHLQTYLDEVDRLGVQTPRDAANFYSGGRAAEHSRLVAEEHAARTATTTLEQTPGGRWLDDQGLFGATSPIDGDEAFEVWSRTSTRYAEQASGDVRAFVRDPNPDGVFLTKELPALQRGLDEGRVTSIEIVDLAAGTRTVLRPGGVRETFPTGGGS